MAPLPWLLWVTLLEQAWAQCVLCHLLVTVITAACWSSDCVVPASVVRINHKNPLFINPELRFKAAYRRNVPSTIFSHFVDVSSSSSSSSFSLSDDLETVKKKTFVLKEGVEYKIKIVFKVRESGFSFSDQTFLDKKFVTQRDVVASCRSTRTSCLA